MSTVEIAAGGYGAPASGPTAEDERLLAAIRRGDERGFADLVERHSSAMLRLALMCTSNRAVAEEIVQEAWLGVVQGIDRFEGRSSLKTWVGRIVLYIGRTRAQREGRQVPFSAHWDGAADPGEPAVDPDRFIPAGEEWGRHWVSLPKSWDEIPETRLLSNETTVRIRRAIEALPPQQREVISLRDVQGWDSDEVCNVLGISATNQRVLLHRARSKVRRALEEYLTPDA